MNKRTPKRGGNNSDQEDQSPVWFGLVKGGLMGFVFCLGFFPRQPYEVFQLTVSSHYVAASACLLVVCLGLLVRSFQTAALYAGNPEDKENSAQNS